MILCGAETRLIERREITRLNFGQSFASKFQISNVDLISFHQFSSIVLNIIILRTIHDLFDRSSIDYLLIVITSQS
jgi:hypothetical protein